MFRFRRNGTCSTRRLFATAALGQELPRDLLERLRRAQQVALDLGAAERAHVGELLLGLDALDGGDHVEAVREAGDALDDRERALLVRDVLHERAVDLDLVEREAAQVAQAGVAGAEIVHREVDAERAQLMQGGERGRGVLHQHGLGDLEFQPAGRQARARQRPHDDLEQALADQLDGGEVDRHLDVLRPGRRVGAGAVDHPFADRDDQAELLGERDEIARRDQPAHRMLPADQRLEAGDLAGLQARRSADRTAGTRRC